MSRNFGIQSGSASLGGASTDRPASRDNYASRDSNVVYLFEPPDSSDHYELGGFLLFGGIVLCPWVIVLGLVMAYLVFV